MLKSFFDNKKAIQVLCIEESLDDCALNGEEWRLVQDFVETLKVFYSATLFLQRRDTTVSYVIPIIKAIKHDLEVKQALGFGNESFIDALLTSLDERYTTSLSKRNLIIATLLDPRFKLDFLDEHMTEVYKQWVVEDIVGKSEMVTPEVQIQYCEQDDLFSSYLKVNKLAPEPPGKSEQKHLVEAELIAYLHEPVISRDLTAGSYWKINSGRFPYLSKLYCKHATAPATSAEAERLFSIA
uniref:HAT C-terminal dimerisation domain-containing protein n=1 Tax=Panagrolaimus sp. ES5 TaxID=591445 RepID=A0AC34G7L7_9BILA